MDECNSPQNSKPGNRLTHGLFSNRRAEPWLRNVNLFAQYLLLNEPKTPHTVAAARDLAHTYHFIQAVKSERNRVLSTPGFASHKTNAVSSINLFGKNKRELKKLDEYERKALSRLRKQITRLDYVIFETKRLMQS